VLLPEKRLAEFEPLIRARTEDVPVYVMEIAELSKLTGFPFFQGVLAVGKIPEAHTLESIFARSVPPRLFVAIDGLTNAENVGLIVRNCAAFGAQALLVDDSSASPFLRRSVRNSMGTIFKLPIVECSCLECGDLSPLSAAVTRRGAVADKSAAEKAMTSHRTPNLAAALEFLRAKRIRVIAAHLDDHAIPIQNANFAEDCCIIFGSEGQGISTSVLAACDECVVIPMSNGVDSLNVGSAAAALLYEAARQRR
jgi:tRNA G18 (ribose-2'-O)-methylase SpoU